ncbi:MAG TPA: DUF481 domain-containing protein [Candidatus Hydrogenedentes bacterium]|jgi:hypothetical protein|nr:DUF481 domain-containing protein [Candidatus Hydrogenedentota bacterium]HPJ98808.1 DUF481 domain-containing protein [Candidatus Hydrogenedentota bacterium]
MRTNRFILAGVASLAAVLTAASGDVLSLTRGDLVNGTLRDLSDGIVVFDTGLAGQIIVPVTQVRSLSTDSPFFVHLGDGRRLEGRFAGSGVITRIVPENGGEAAVLSLAAVKNIEPAPDKHAEAASPDTLAPAQFSLETGYLHRWANEDYDAAFARLTLRKQAGTFGLFSENLFELSDDERFPRLFRSSVDWRFPADSSLLPELGIEAERDLDAGLAFRGSLHAGLARAFIDEPGRLFELTGGLNAAFEYYDASELAQSSGSRLRQFVRRLYYADEWQREQNQDINLRLRLRFHQIIRESLLTQTISLHPSLTDFGELRARSESSFRMPLTSQLNFRFDLLFDYDNEPHYEWTDSFRTFIGAGFEWDF